MNEVIKMPQRALLGFPISDAVVPEYRRQVATERKTPAIHLYARDVKFEGGITRISHVESFHCGRSEFTDEH